MWKMFNKKKNNNKTSTTLRVRLDADMDYIGLDKDIQKGFLFFLGASMNIGFKRTGLNLSEFNTNESEYLKNLEKTNSFSEAVKNRDGKKIPFFDKGAKRDWSKSLDLELKLKIENNFRKEMLELGYL